MKCPFCGNLGDKVVDSRESKEGEVIRRRRECLVCARRFTSYERVEEVPLVILKKDGRREPFERVKLMKEWNMLAENVLGFVDYTQNTVKPGTHHYDSNIVIVPTPAVRAPTPQAPAR